MWALINFKPAPSLTLLILLPGHVHVMMQRSMTHQIKQRHSHSSQLSLPLAIQRPFLFLIQPGWHVEHSPFCVHAPQPLGQAMHSCRFLSE